MPDLLSSAEAAAHAARLSQASFISYPSPLLAGMNNVIAKHAIAEFESQSSAMSAAMAAAIGKRVFVPLAGPQSIGDFFSASFQRLPIVAANLSQFLGAYTARSDLNDILSVRDAGWIIFLAESNQEILDSVIMAYRLSEETMLPSVVNINTYADFREPVHVPQDKKVANFLPAKKADMKKAAAFNPPVEDYMEFKAQQQRAMDSASAAAEKICAKWKEKFGRSYGAAEKYMLDDADYAFVLAGFNSGTCKAAVDNLRAQGEKAGMLRIRMMRPFPAAAAAEALKNAKKVAVLDENISLGSSGIIHTELAQHYHGFSCNFISLGRHLTENTFMEIFQHLKKADSAERMWLM